MTRPVLKLVAPGARPRSLGGEQLVLRPVLVFVREGMPVPFRVVLACRRRPPARARRPPPATAPPVPATADLLSYRPKRRARKLVAVPAAFAPRKLRPGARPRSLGVRPMTTRERRQLRADERALRRRGVLQARPRTFGDCAADAGPCPWVSCVHHLYLEVDETTGAIKLNFPDREVDQLAATCSLKVVDARGALSLEEVGKLVNLTQERVSQIEEGGFEKMEAAGVGGGRV